MREFNDERSNYQLFLAELCALLGVPGPDPATVADFAKSFQRANKDRIAKILQTLTALDTAKKTEEGEFHRAG